MEYMTAMSDYLPVPATGSLAGQEVAPIAWGMWRFAGADVGTARAHANTFRIHIARPSTASTVTRIMITMLATSG